MIPYLEHHIVDHCNLKCAGCTHFSCLVNKPWFESLEDFVKDFSVLADKSNQNIPVIRLMGGEPLLHPEWPHFLKIARELFPIGNIQIVTNGLLLPKYHDELVQVCNDNYIQICISDYGLKIDLSSLLKDFKYKRVDGKTSLYNACLNLEAPYNPREAFNYCDLHVNKWYYFQHGRFYPCCIAANIQYFEDYFHIRLRDLEWIEDDYSISIHDHSIQEIEDFLNEPIPLCKYCNTILRPHTYKPFSTTKGDITEWICQ